MKFRYPHLSKSLLLGRKGQLNGAPRERALGPVRHWQRWVNSPLEVRGMDIPLITLAPVPTSAQCSSNLFAFPCVPHLQRQQLSALLPNTNDQSACSSVPCQHPRGWPQNGQGLTLGSQGLLPSAHSAKVLPSPVNSGPGSFP